MQFLLLSALTLPLLALAHFQIEAPAARGFDEDQLATYPCGGQNAVSSNRTMFPMSGGPIQLKMGHDHAELQVNLALGNEAVDGNAFNINILPIIQEEGLGEFCIGGIMIPSDLNMKDGDNATIQVITNGDPSGGLYNCADITFSSSAQPGQCNNGTNVRAVPFTGDSKNANGSDASTATSQSAASSTPTGAATSLSPMMAVFAGSVAAVFVVIAL